MKYVVIITHRHHFHICQVAFDMILKRLKPDRVTFIYDDVPGTAHGWNGIGKSLVTKLMFKHNTDPGMITSMGFSALNGIHTEPNGWIRQQYIKLNLHNLIDGDEWVVIDGDTLIGTDIDPWSFWYVNPNDQFRLHHDWFTRYTLGLKNERVTFNNAPVELSSVPIRFLTRQALSNLESHIYELHGTNIRGVRDSFTLRRDRDFFLELSEYDLLGHFQTFISKDLLPLKELGPRFVPASDLYTQWDSLQNEIAVLHGADNLPIEWYQKMDVEIDQNIWNVLYENKN